MMRGKLHPAAIGALFLLVLASANAAVAASQKFGDGATLRNERHGFLIAYPTQVFPQQANQTADEGQVFYSGDGRAQLPHRSLRKRTRYDAAGLPEVSA